MYKHYTDQVIRRCVLEEEMESILNHCHTLSCGGGGGALWGGRRKLQRYFNRDSTSLAYSRTLTSFLSTCDKCQRMVSISKQV